VVLVDDHTIVRQGVRALLAATPDLVVVAEASDAEGCYRVVEAERPDVAVVDLSLSTSQAMGRGVHGTEVVQRLKAMPAGPRVVVLSMHAAPEVVARARAAGCDAYVVKGGDVAELAEAIRVVAARGSYFSSSIEGVEGAMAARPDGGHPIERLSGRERQILGLIARSGTNKTIAAELGISIHTVNAHRTSLMAKLDIHDAQGLTRFAVENGLFDDK
jgi:DNA-binding NarL/FixJ family response regulator